MTVDEYSPSCFEVWSNPRQHARQVPREQVGLRCVADIDVEVAKMVWMKTGVLSAVDAGIHSNMLKKPQAACCLSVPQPQIWEDLCNMAPPHGGVRPGSDCDRTAPDCDRTATDS